MYPMEMFVDENIASLDDLMSSRAAAKESAEDLAGGRLRDLVDELDGSQLLVARNLAGHELTQVSLVGRRFGIQCDEGLGQFPGFVVGDPNNGAVGHRVVREQEGLQLCGGNLEPLSSR